jgi:hypothetical protein
MAIAKMYTIMKARKPYQLNCTGQKVRQVSNPLPAAIELPANPNGKRGTGRAQSDMKQDRVLDRSTIPLETTDHPCSCLATLWKSAAHIPRVGWLGPQPGRQGALRSVKTRFIHQ